MCIFLIFRGKQTRQIFRQSNSFLCLIKPIWRQAIVTAPLVATPSLDHGLELLSYDVTVHCMCMCRVYVVIVCNAQCNMYVSSVLKLAQMCQLNILVKRNI